MLPFTVEQFFAVFTDYNQNVWPAQWALRAAAVGVLVLSVSGAAWRDRAICVLLSGLWAWMAVAYHLLHFASINPAAYIFAAFFLAQAALCLWWSISGRPLSLAFRADLRGTAAVAILAYALIAYPLLSARLGHTYPATPTFGVPCPTTIFTLGTLVTARAPRIWILLIVPMLWSVVGGSASILLNVWQDLGLLASGLTAAVVIGGGRIRVRS